MNYPVTVIRVISITVDVDADSPEKAAKTVNRRDYQLPDHSQWDTVKGDEFVVYDSRGEILYEEEADSPAQ